MLVLHAIRILAGFVLFVYGIKNKNDYLNPRQFTPESMRQSLIDDANNHKINNEWKIELQKLESSKIFLFI